MKNKKEKQTPAFKYRHEIKYRINKGTYHILRQRFAAVAEHDANTKDGLYRVTSLYFDDIYRSAYNDKVNGVLNRKKYRVRLYDLDEKFIRLEEKVKNNNVGYKKTSRLTAEEYGRLLSGDRAFLSEERFTDSAGGDFFVSDSAAFLRPAVIVDYIREPFICRAGNVRLTFDMKVSACVNGCDILDKNNIYETVMPDSEVILEVKFDEFLPIYIDQLISGISSQQESVSKYVMCADRLYGMI